MACVKTKTHLKIYPGVFAYQSVKTADGRPLLLCKDRLCEHQEIRLPVLVQI